MSKTASSSKMRFTGRGPYKTLNAPTPASIQINQGDLLWLNSGVATPANLFTWDTNLATTQPEFRVLFLGVANEDKSSLDASTRAIQVITEGIFAFDCAALGGALHIGNFLGPAKDTGNNSLLDQVLASVATYDLSIATLWEEAALGATSLACYVQSYLALTKAQKS